MKVGTGVSRERNSRQAGQDAASAAMAQLSGQLPGLVIVFTTPVHDLKMLLEGIRAVTGSATLVGATGSGEIVAGEYLGFGEGVGVLILASGTYRFGVASGSHIRADLARAGQAITSQSLELVGDTSHAAVLLLTDSMLGDLQQFFYGVYRVAGPRAANVGASA